MTYFVFSDVHSHYVELLNALDKKGFDKHNPDHMLIVNGDIFDRGDYSLEIKKYLDSVNNKICIMGNHEAILLSVINAGRFDKHDLSNGVVDTMIQLAGGYLMYAEHEYIDKARDIFREKYKGSNKLDNEYLQKLIIKNLISTGIVEWIVDNFYIEGSVVRWNEDKTRFVIDGKARYYVQIGNKLFIHGFFPSPDYSVMLTNDKLPGKVYYGVLPPNYDLLESDAKEWERYSTGIWANTPYWLSEYYMGRLPELVAYLKKRKVRHIYIGHWFREELGLASLNLIGYDETTKSLDLVKYDNRLFERIKKLPKIHYLDGNVVKNKMVVVEKFTVKSE